MNRRKPIGQRLAEEYEAYQRYLLPKAPAVADTPGAWEVTDDEHSPGVHEYGIWANDGEYGRYVVEVIPSKADADLIVHAVNTLRARHRPLLPSLPRVVGTAPCDCGGGHAISAEAPTGHAVNCAVWGGER